MNSRKPHSRRGGFSLIELLAAAAVFAILGVLMLSAAEAMLRAAGAGSADVERAEKAGLITSSLTRDLQAALLPVVPNNLSNLQILINSSAAPNFLHPHNVFFQAPVSGGTAGTDIAIVGYCIRWDTTNADNPRATLCRIAAPLNDPLVLQAAWATNALVDTTASASPDTDPPFQGLLATDVIALWIRSEDRDGNFTYSYDSRAGLPVPVAIDIAFVVLDSDSAERLDSVPTYTASNAASMDDEVADFVDQLPAGVRSGARIFKIRVTPAVFRVAS